MRASLACSAGTGCDQRPRVEAKRAAATDVFNSGRSIGQVPPDKTVTKSEPGRLAVRAGVSIVYGAIRYRRGTGFVQRKACVKLAAGRCGYYFRPQLLSVTSKEGLCGGH